MYADDEGASDVLAKFYERRRAGQQRWIREMQEAVERVSGAEEYQSNGDTGPIVVTEVPFFDVELIGVPALGYLGRESFSDSPAFSYLLKDEGKQAELSIVKLKTASSIFVGFSHVLTRVFNFRMRCSRGLKIHHLWWQGWCR
jgi:hypothetical protein